MNGRVTYVEDVAAAFATLVAEQLPATIALSGGGAARRCYEKVADLPGATVFFGDERWVPLEDDESNEGMARQALLDRSNVGTVHSLRGAGDDIETAAEAYDARLTASPQLDLVHLGLGPDGHTASLFPGSPALAVTHRLVIATGDDAHPHPRLSFTFPAIARARLAVVTVEGEEKAEAWARVQADDPGVPASHIRADDVLWLVSSGLKT